MLLSILSPILLIAAFPNFNLSFLAFIGFVPLFFAIQNKSPKQAFLISYLCGFLFYLGTLYWLYHVTAGGLIVLCLYLALYFGIFGLFLRFTLHPVPHGHGARLSPFTILTVPLLWTILEYIQARLFTGFGWALLGYSQYKNPVLIQIADFSGVYGVSFIIMMVNFAVYRIFKKSFREIAVACVILSAVIGYGAVRIGEETEKRAAAKNDVRVSVIQGNIPQHVKWDASSASDILDKYIFLTKSAAVDKPDLIIWPETSFPGFFLIDEDLTDRVRDLAKDIKTPLLIGTNTVEEKHYFNSAVLISVNGEIADKYDKIHLVPFGEYVPFSDRIPFLHDMVFGELGEFSKGKDFNIFKFKTDFGVLICFEDIFPELARRLVRAGAKFLVVITNDAWYGDSGAPYQHAACSVFRAVENRVPVVRCANTGYSCFIDSTGKIYDSVEKNNVHLFVSGYKSSRI
jgi:apolipoprotein N-acyltransferase